MGDSEVGDSDQTWAEALLSQVIRRAQLAAADAFSDHAQQLRSAAASDE
ncbi:MAG: hypothetical protein IIA02_10660 [Proteobacteria bacterium]|nr:hypothetical protein [Pseudomonadota bacterium]